MGLIPDKDRRYLEHLFAEKLKEQVRIIVFTQDFECQYCKENRELMLELSSLSEKIRVEVYDFVNNKEEVEKYKVKRIPATILAGDKDYGIRFYGVPFGYEFSTLVDDIIDVSNRSSRLKDSTKKLVREIDRDVHIQVFVTPTCPYCPRAVRIAHQFALENDKVFGDMVEAIEFPELSNRYNVAAVPKVVINDKVSFEGALPEDVFLSYIKQALER
jgi:glutaredoxin-like protein